MTPSRLAPRCAFGTIWPCGPCAKCRAYAATLEASFWRAVFLGVYDARGYVIRTAQREARA